MRNAYKIIRAKGTFGTMDYSVEVDKISKEAWTKALVTFDDSNIYQTWSYGEIRWGRGHLSHLVIKNKETVVAMVQVTIKVLPILRRGIAYIPWGPVWRKRGGDAEHNIMTAVLKAINEEYAKKRQLLVRIAPQDIIETDAWIEQTLSKEGYLFKSRPYKTIFVNLSDPMDKLLSASSRRWKRALKMADQKDLKIVCGTGDDLYEIFKTLYEEMVERKNFNPAIDINEFQLIQRDLQDEMKMKIMICYFKEKVVAALIASCMGEKGIGLLGATGNAGMNLGGFHLLNWKMMEWMKSKGAKHYDFGGYDPINNPGTASFKESIAGNIVNHVGVFELSKSKISSWVVEKGEKMRSNQKYSAFFKKHIAGN